MLRMCLLHFRDSLHSLNGNCSNLSATEFNHPVTSTIYITIAVLCLLLSLASHFRYNSIRVLNLTLRSNVISNTPWIVYFLVLFVRSVMGSVIYVKTAASDQSQGKMLTIYFYLDGAFKSLEVFCLCWALNHQWMNRSGGFLQQEINGFNSGEYSASESERGSVMSAASQQIKNDIAGAVFVAQFILAVVLMILMEELTINEVEPDVFFWIYISLFWSQCISTIVFAVLIATTQNEDGPTVMVKVLFVVGVILTLPGDFPSFIWSCYMNCQCKPYKWLTGYDFALFFSIPSAIAFFVALRMEFLRLDQEAQHAALGSEVDSLFSVHSRTIAES